MLKIFEAGFEFETYLGVLAGSEKFAAVHIGGRRFLCGGSFGMTMGGMSMGSMIHSKNPHRARMNKRAGGKEVDEHGYESAPQL